MAESEYSHFRAGTSSGVAGLDPDTSRPLSPAERTGREPTVEPTISIGVLQSRLDAARRLVAHLEQQIEHRTNE